MHADCDEDRAAEIAEFIAEEIALVQAYTTAWRGSGTVENPLPQNVQDELHAEAASRIFPWPNISERPVAQTSDGGLVKAHLLVFPKGCGDYRQPRLRTDFTPVEWTQHVFRYFGGRVLSSLRGQRAVWAVFNTAMQQLSFKSGALLHKQSGMHALSKAALRDLVNEHTDLVSKLGRFGADVPSTAMQWKREGNELEWIVRQMSWQPPWTQRGQDNIQKDVRTRSTAIHKSRPGSTRNLVAEPAEVAPDDAFGQFQQAAVINAKEPSRDDDERSHDAPFELSETESLNESERSLATSDVAAGQDVDLEVDTAKEIADSASEDGLSDASSQLKSSAQQILHSEKVWRRLPSACVADRWGYGRNPAFWYT